MSKSNTLINYFKKVNTPEKPLSNIENRVDSVKKEPIEKHLTPKSESKSFIKQVNFSVVKFEHISQDKSLICRSKLKEDQLNPTRSHQNKR